MYLYETIIDFWTGWKPFFEKEKNVLSKSYNTIPLGVKEFNFLLDFVATVQKVHGWEERRDDTEYYYRFFGVIEGHDSWGVASDCEEIALLIGVKFHNNGTTIIGSTHKIPLDMENIITDILPPKLIYFSPTINEGISQRFTRIEELLEELQKSEINVQLSGFYDLGYEAKIGDQMNGFAESFTSKNIYEVKKWLIETVLKKYPDSLFAKKFT